jgi:hypothetical protein
MKPLVLLLLSASLLAAKPTPTPTPAPTPTPVPTPETRDQITARSKALELAGAFANDGYKVRDGYWGGMLEPGKPQILEINLFAGNSYWVSAAALSPARKLSVKIFDENGKPVKGESYEEGLAAAAGLVADASGRYFVRVELVEGEKADFCLIYSYK